MKKIILGSASLIMIIGFIVFEISLYLLTASAFDSFLGDILFFLLANLIVFFIAAIVYSFTGLASSTFGGIITSSLLLCMFVIVSYIYWIDVR